MPRLYSPEFRQREMWGEIVRKLDQLQQHPGSPDVETETCDEADEAYDPIEFAEEDEF